MKKAKKLYAFLTALTMCSTVAALAACENVPEGDTHEHHFVWTSTTATCEEPGEDTLTCDHEGCEETKTEPAEALGHDYGEWSVKTAAGCETPGEDHRVCSRDESHEETRPVDALGHDYGEWSVKTPAGCETLGVEHRVCSHDESHEETRSIPAKGHTPAGEVLDHQDATCVVSGFDKYLCATCGEEYTITLKTTGHTPYLSAELDETGSYQDVNGQFPFIDENGEPIPVYLDDMGEPILDEEGNPIMVRQYVRVEPTCTEEGYEEGTCTVCGEDYHVTLSKVPHVWSDWKVPEGHLCTEEGDRTRHCLNCDEEETKNFPAGEHVFADWEVLSAATCEEDGLRKHACANCGHEEDEVIEKLGHRYTEWFITNAPSETETGLAVKYCEGTTADDDHTVRVTLPVLTKAGTGYSSVIYDQATYICTLEHEEGTISFKVMAKANTVEQAVYIASETQKNVIKAEATRSNVSVSQQETSIVDPVWSNLGYGTHYRAESSSKITYELGYNYVHVNDKSEGKETFYTLNPDGTIFAVLKTNIGGEHGAGGGVEEGSESTGTLIEKDVTATLDAFNGFGYSFTYLSGGQKFYGTSGLISYLYNIGQANINKDFMHDMTVDEDGKQIFRFSFGYVYGKYYDVVSVEFTFDSNSIVDYAKVQVKTYAKLEFYTNETYQDSEGTWRYVMKYIDTFTKNTDGTCRLKAGREGLWSNCETYVITQKNYLDEGESLPTNPYNYNDFVINSFNIQYGEDILSDGDTLILDARESAELNIVNVLPSTYNPYFDEFKVMLIDDLGFEIEATSIVNVKEGEIGYNFYKGMDGVNVGTDYKITIQSYVSGHWTLKIVTKDNVLTLDLIVNAVAPETIYAEVYQVNDVTNKATWNRTVSETEVYTGQDLKFRTAVDHPAYESLSCTVSVTKDGSPATDCVNLTDEDGLPVYVFNAEEAGEYVITVRSALNSSTYTTLTVTVKEAPDLAALLSGQYSNENLGYSVTLEPEEEGALNGTATIVKGFDDATETTVISYSYNKETKEFTSEYVSGASGDYVQGTTMPYNYNFYLSSAYKLYLTYDSQFVIGETEKVLIAGITNSLVCSNAIAPSVRGDMLNVNVSGRYHLTSSGVFVAVNGEQLTGIKTSLDLELYVGDYIQVWNGMSPGTRYSITLEEELVPVAIEGVALEDDKAEVKLNDSLQLVAVLTPVNTTEKQLFWSSSDESIVLVDANGLVRGLAMGTATVTVTSSNGRFSDTIEITVVNPFALKLGQNDLMYDGPGNADDYTFKGVAGKQYNVAILSDTSCTINYNGIPYYLTYNPGNNTAEFIATADANGNVVINIQNTGYGHYGLTVTITEAAAPVGPTPNFEVVNSGDSVYFEITGLRYLTVVGTPNTVYEVTVNNATLYAVENKQYNVSVSAQNKMKYTTDENGFADICFYPGNGPTTYTVTFELVGEAVEVVDGGVVVLTSGTNSELSAIDALKEYVSKDGVWTSANMGLVEVYGTKLYAYSALGTVKLTFTPNGNEAPVEFTVIVTGTLVENGSTLDLTSYTDTPFTYKGEANATYVIKTGNDSVQVRGLSEYGTASFDDAGYGSHTLTADENGYLHFFGYVTADCTATVTFEKA